MKRPICEEHAPACDEAVSCFINEGSYVNEIASIGSLLGIQFRPRLDGFEEEGFDFIKYLTKNKMIAVKIKAPR